MSRDDKPFSKNKTHISTCRDVHMCTLLINIAIIIRVFHGHVSASPNSPSILPPTANLSSWLCVSLKQALPDRSHDRRSCHVPFQWL